MSDLSREFLSSLEQKYGLPSGMLYAQMMAESGGDPAAKSPKGALGAFQFMPATASEYGIDPLDPIQSAEGAARMNADMLKKYGGDVPSALAAYNWGQGNVDRKGLQNAPEETRGYISKIMSGIGDMIVSPAYAEEVSENDVPEGFVPEESKSDYDLGAKPWSSGVQVASLDEDVPEGFVLEESKTQQGVPEIVDNEKKKEYFSALIPELSDAFIAAGEDSASAFRDVAGAVSPLAALYKMSSGEAITPEQAEYLESSKPYTPAIDVAKGLGKGALASMSMLWSPVTAINKALVGNPIENATGIPAEYTDLALSLIEPYALPKALKGAKAIANTEAGQNAIGKAAKLFGADVNAAKAEYAGGAAAESDFIKNISDPIEKRFAEKLQNYSAAKAEYSAIPESLGGKVLNTDMARELSEDYIKNRTLSANVHEPASGFTKKLYAEKLRQKPSLGEDPTVLFTAGGTGAGKTSAVNTVLGDSVNRAQIIYDTNMNNIKSADQKIKQALMAGKNVKIAYVYRDPIEALTGGALPRAMRQEAMHGTGRTVPIEEHLATHEGSYNTVKSLYKKYKNNKNVSFGIIDNSKGKGNVTETTLDKLPKPSFDIKTLRSALNEQKNQGKISESVYKGFAEGRAKGGGQVLGEGAGSFAKPSVSKTPVSSEAFKTQANQAYKQAEELGGTLPANYVDDFLKEANAKAPQTEAGKLIAGENEVSKVLSRMEKLKGKPLSLQESQEIDEALGVLIDKNTDMGRLTKEGKNLWDIQTEFRKTMQKAAGDASLNTEGFTEWKRGQKLWSQQMAMRDIERILTRAELSNQPATIIRNGFRTILSNPSRLKSFTKTEQEAIRTAAKTGAKEELLRAIGSRLTQYAVGGAGFMGGGVLGAVGGAAGAHAVSNMARNASAKLGQKKIAKVMETIAKR